MVLSPDGWGIVLKTIEGATPKQVRFLQASLQVFLVFMVFKGFVFPSNLADAVKEVATKEYSGKYESDIVREGVVEWIKKNYPKVSLKYRLVSK